MFQDSTANGNEEAMELREFAEYSDWAIFTENCCCMPGSTNDEYLEMELWKCRNGYQKVQPILKVLHVLQERLRVHKTGDTVESGLQLRPLCGYLFNSTIVCKGPLWDGTKFVVEPSEGTQVTEYAATFLW